MPNALVQAASPYLRQHADNPVDWVEWSDAAFARARAEGKLVLVSSGYAACHWCHVMAHESFEDAEVAAVLNAEYVCIKVDREERPDVDQVYLDAVQLMTGRGGWPLNCFVLPDGRPVYGGTYFPRAQWLNLLRHLADLHRNEPDSILQQADKITAHLRRMEQAGGAPDARPVDWIGVIAGFASRFDRNEGGTGRAPKFPMPCEWAFLLRYGTRTGDAKILDQVRLTLDRMAAGGIHDHLAGGFARYSVDGEWKVPHFEKMLYDNAQLLRLYAEAHVALDAPRYREVALDIAAFVESELSAEGPLAGGWCSALDADSEGEEGLFYVWHRAELRRVLGDRHAVVCELLGVDPEADTGPAYWEDGRHVLLRTATLEEWGARHGLDAEAAAALWRDARADLLAARAERTRPARDDKVLTGWNGLMIGALADAARLLHEPALARRAARCADVLLTHALRPDGGLWRRGSPHARSARSVETGGADEALFGIHAFLEDYACLADGLVALYQATFEERWLFAARGLADHALARFSDPDGVSPLLYFVADDAPPVLVRKRETQDNVIPSSNAMMAGVLFALAEYCAEPAYRARAEAMCAAQRGELSTYGPAYAHWAAVLFTEEQHPATLAVVGPEAPAFLDAASGHFLPHLRLAGTRGASEVPLLQGKDASGETTAFRCVHGACDLPTPDWRGLLEAGKAAWSARSRETDAG